MDLPIKFPSQVDVVDEEVARFRRLSPEDRLRSIRGLLAAGSLMMQQSQKASFMREYTLEQEFRSMNLIKEFINRYGR